MKSIKPGKQRKRLYNAPLHKKRKWVAAHLAEKLLLKYDHRSASVVTGDTVKVMRGSFKGHEDKIAKVDVNKRSIEIEGITMPKADGTKIAKTIHPSNVIITKLNLTDKWRRKKLERGLSEETKKEIEKEGEEQIKDAEEKRKKEEEKKALEEEEEHIKELEESEETEKPEEKTKPKKPEVGKKKVEKKTTPKTKPKKEEKTTTIKKPSGKKEAPTKKETVKKTPTKTTNKKEAKK